jgi:Anti-sigma-K factor rskA
VTPAGDTPGEHVEEELPALVSGELDLDATRAITGHLRSCAVCRAELVEVAAGIAVMRRLDQTEPPVAAPVSIETARAGTGPRSRTRWILAAAAAVAIVFAGAVGTAAILADRGADGPDAKVALAPVSGAAARGSVAMTDAGGTQAMEVATSLGAAPTDSYYEVWLLDRTTGKMLPVGVLPPDGTGTYRLPGSLLEQYDTVDISLQPDNGGTAHSDDSVLRADYA